MMEEVPKIVDIQRQSDKGKKNPQDYVKLNSAFPKRGLSAAA